MMYNVDMATRDGKEAKYKLVKYEGHNEKYQGQMVRVYEDGCIRDSKGYMVEKHPMGVTITQDNASALRDRRYELAAERARAAIGDEIGAIMPGIMNNTDAWGALAGKLAFQIWESKIPRGFDLKILGEIAGFVPREKAVEQPEQVQNSTIMDVLGALRDVLQAANVYNGGRVDVVDGE